MEGHPPRPHVCVMRHLPFAIPVRESVVSQVTFVSDATITRKSAWAQAQGATSWLPCRQSAPHQSRRIVVGATPSLRGSFDALFWYVMAFCKRTAPTSTGRRLAPLAPRRALAAGRNAWPPRYRGAE